MKTSDHTASEWKWLGLTMVAVGVVMAIVVSPIVGIVVAVLGALIFGQIHFGIGASPRPDAGRRD